MPPYLYEADAWFRIIRKLKYTKVVLIHSQDIEGRLAASRFQMLTEDSDIHVRCLITIYIVDPKMIGPVLYHQFVIFDIIKSNEEHS